MSIHRLTLLIAEFVWFLSLALGLWIPFHPHFSPPLGIALALYGLSALLDGISTKIALSKPNVREINPIAAYIFSRFGLGAKAFVLVELSILAVVLFLRVLPHNSTPAIFRSTRLRMRLWSSRMRFTRATRPQKDRASIRCSPKDRTITLNRVSIQFLTLPIQPFHPVSTTLPPLTR